MKQILIILLAGLMLVSLVACGGSGGGDTSTESSNNNSNVSDVSTPSEDASAQTATIAQTLLQDFQAQVNADATLSAQAIADKLLENPIIQFSGASMPVEPGLLTGFGNTEITGFSDGAMFAPTIGTIPFIGYIFILNEDTDTAAFVQTLKDNADPRWNICTTADETVTEHVGSTVFFVMAPTQFEE